MMGLIIMAIGIIKLLITFIGQSTYKTEMKMKDVFTEATIVSIKTHTHWENGKKEEQLIPVLSYVVNGKKYKQEYVPEWSVDLTRRNTYVGKKLKIACSSHSPEYITVVTPDNNKGHYRFHYKLSAVILIIGIVFFALDI